MRESLADAVLLVHALFIVFVIGGFLLTVIGIWLRWVWVRSPLFRVLHLAAILLVVAQAWVGVWCPLTTWENALREAAGHDGYRTSFVAHWMQRLIYYDAPRWVFTLAYTAFAALVILTWILVPPRRARHKTRHPTAT